VRARLAAVSTVVVEPGRQRSAMFTFFVSDIRASRARTGSGAVSQRLEVWGVARTSREGGQDSNGASCTGAFSVTFRPTSCVRTEPDSPS
jgi:hypothetical protein